MSPGYAPHAPAPALVESLIPGAHLAFGIDVRAGNLKMSGSDVPFDERRTVQTEHDDRTDKQTQNCHNRRIMQRLRSPAFGFWMYTEKTWHINCLELKAVHLALKQKFTTSMFSFIWTTCQW